MDDTPAAGLRWMSAIPSASTASSERRSSRIDQPTTRRLQVSITQARKRKPSQGGDVGDVSDPQSVRSRCLEGAADAIRRRRLLEHVPVLSIAKELSSIAWMIVDQPGG